MITETITTTLQSGAVFGQSYTVTAGQQLIICLLVTYLAVNVLHITYDLVYGR